VVVAIENTKTSKWWNGSSFGAASETFVAATGTSSWSLALSAANLGCCGSYKVIAQATDSLGNIGTSSPVTFTYCAQKSTPPTVTVTYPAKNAAYGTNWTGTITGTASSNSGTGTTVVSVVVAIENTKTSKWWNGSSFSATTQTFVSAAGTSSWSLALPAGNLTSGATYTVVAKATDSLGNIGTSCAFTFTFDTAVPTVSITYPATNASYGTNWTGTITGKASSNAGTGTSVASVAVAIENTTTSTWWNGSSFGASGQTFVTVTGTTSWLLALGRATLTSGDSYTVVAKATDSLGNTATSGTVTFKYNATPPTVAITYPANSVSYGANWTGAITGTASSNSGTGTTVAGVTVAIENTETSKWWNGSSFSATTQTFVSVSGTTSWKFSMAAGTLTSGDTYTVVAKAIDSLGNTATSGTVTFAYNTTPPTVTITYPVSKGTYDASASSWTGAITGTASSNSGTGTTVASVTVAIENTKTSKWWNGSSFGATTQTFVPAIGASNWSLGLAAGNLSSGATYTVVARATDSLGNVGTSSTVTFSFDTTPPTITKVYAKYMGDCAGECSTGIYLTIVGTNFVSGATVSFPGTGASADFSVVSGSVTVVSTTTIVLEVRDTGATTGSATVVVTDPGESPASGSITATGSAGFTSLVITAPTLIQGTSATLNLSVAGSGCAKWGTLAVYFSNPGITGGKVTCSGASSPYTVSIPITASSSALPGNSSVTVVAPCGSAAISANGLTVGVASSGASKPSALFEAVDLAGYGQSFSTLVGTFPHTLTQGQRAKGAIATLVLALSCDHGAQIDTQASILVPWLALVEDTTRGAHWLGTDRPCAQDFV
jgi:hypothetical protein